VLKCFPLIYELFSSDRITRWSLIGLLSVDLILVVGIFWGIGAPTSFPWSETLVDLPVCSEISFSSVLKAIQIIAAIRIAFILLVYATDLVINPVAAIVAWLAQWVYFIAKGAAVTALLPTVSYRGGGQALIAFGFLFSLFESCIPVVRWLVRLASARSTTGSSEYAHSLHVLSL